MVVRLVKALNMDVRVELTKVVMFLKLVDGGGVEVNVVVKKEIDPLNCAQREVMMDGPAGRHEARPGY